LISGFYFYVERQMLRLNVNPVRQVAAFDCAWLLCMPYGGPFV